MLKKTLTYTDYNGNERTEDFYFNLNKAEVIDLEVSSENGLDKDLQKAVEEKNAKELIKWFKKILLSSYGKRSEDGERFVKSEKISEEFSQTAAYPELFSILATQEGEAEAFLKGVMPQDMVKNLK